MYMKITEGKYSKKCPTWAHGYVATKAVADDPLATPRRQAQFIVKQLELGGIKVGPGVDLRLK